MGLTSSIVGSAAGASLGTLFVELTAKSTDLVKGMQEAEDSVKDGSDVMVKELGLMSAAFVAAFALVGVDAVKEFAKFDAALVQSTSLISGLSKEMQKQMGDIARTMSKDTVSSAEELVQAYQGLHHAQIDAKDSAAALQIVDEYALASTKGIKVATEELTDTLSAFGLRTKDSAQNVENLQRVSDVFTKGAMLATSTINELAQAMNSRAGPALRDLHKSLEEGVAVIAAYGDAGVKGELAGSQLALVLRVLQTEAVKNNVEFQNLGISVFDAYGRMRNMADIAKDMEKSLGPMATAERRAALELLGFQDRSLQAVIQLIGLSDKIKEYQTALEEAGGATKEVAEKNLDSMGAQLEILRNRMKDFLLTIGEGLSPALKELTEITKELTTNNSNFSDSIKELAHGVGYVLVTAVKAAVDIYNGWRGLLKLIDAAVVGSAELVLSVWSKVLDGIKFYIEGIVNTVISGFNMAIRTLNSLVDKLPDWMLQGPTGIGHVQEVTWKLNVQMPDLKGAINFLDDTRKELLDGTAAIYAEPVKKVEAASKEMSTGVSAAVKKTKTDFEALATEIEKVGFNSLKVTQILDKMGAPKLENFLGQVAGKQTFPEGSKEKAMQDLQNKQMQDQLKTNMNLEVFKAGNIGGFGDQATGTALQLQKEIQLNQSRLTELKRIGQQEGDLNDATLKRMMAAQTLYSKQLKALKSAETQMVLQTASTMFNDLATIAGAFAGKQSGIYKTLFAASKAFAIAESIVKIQQGIASAAALPWPANLAAIASVVAATANIVTTIQSVKLEFAGAKARGGDVTAGKSFLVGEEGPEMFTPNTSGSITPNNRLGSGGTRVVVNNYTDTTPTVTERQEGDEKVIDIMIRRVKNEISSEIRDGRGNVSKSIEQSFKLRRGQ